jgi:hypothetical protein
MVHLAVLEWSLSLEHSSLLSLIMPIDVPSITVYIMYLVTVMERLAYTENWSWTPGVIVVPKPNHGVLRPLELICGGNLEKFGDVEKS